MIKDITLGYFSRKRREFAIYAAIIAVSISVGLAVHAQVSDQYETTYGDPVLYWNNVGNDALAVDYTGTFGPPEQTGPGRAARAMAIMHAAIYDSVNAIDKSYEPYLTMIYIPKDTDVSMDTAIAVAAHDTLIALFPKQLGNIEAAYQPFMAQIPESPRKSAGIQLGKQAAQNILRARENDGAIIEINYTPSNLPGHHRADPMNPNQGYWGPAWGNVRLFVPDSVFNAPTAPKITSKEYAAAYNEVNDFGGDGITTPTKRTQEQTEIGLYWAYDGARKIGTPPRLYNQIVQVIAKDQKNSIVENSRLFALVNIAMADGGCTSWDDKYTDDIWRPIVAIREADEGTGPTGLGDGNPNTVGDTSWTPLGSPASNSTNNNFTPPFPAYPSGHATFGAATFRVIELFYGTDNIPFTFVSDELNGVTTDNKGNVRPLRPRSFTKLSDATKENAQSRIYLGVHWQFDVAGGIELGEKVADNTFAKIMRPKNVKKKTDLSIRTEGPTLAMRGETATYTIHVTNTGPDDGGDVIVKTPVPTGLLYLSARGAECEDVVGTREVHCKIRNIGKNETKDFTITYAVLGIDQ